jgi:hypothetical protein
MGMAHKLDIDGAVDCPELLMTRGRQPRHPDDEASMNGCETPGPAADPLRRTVLAAVKLVHTVAWFSIEWCMVYVLWAGFRRRSDRRAALAAGVVASETLIFAANGFRCPLTGVAERIGAERGSVTDIYLPRWFAHYLPVIHVPLILLAGYSHARNLCARR